VTDDDVRLFIYRWFASHGSAPTVAETAAELSAPAADIVPAFERLEQGHVIVLSPGTSNIWMANPFCAVPTAFRVTTDAGSWWGTCAWDALGIPAMLGTDGVVATSCADCGEAMEMRVAGGTLVADGVAHFAVPARDWWVNIGYT
jgi:hypothetical protein